MGSTNPNPFGLLNNPATVLQGGTGLSVAGAQQGWFPTDNGLLAANSDPYLAATTLAVTAGTLYFAKLSIRSPITITNIWFGLSVAGSGASTGSFVGLYNSAGTLLSGSSDIAASLTGAAGGISNALTTPQAVAAGSFVWAALLVNLATTQPTMCRAANAPGAFPNLNLAAAAFRFATAGTAISVLPGSVTPSSNLGTAETLWAGVS